MKSCAAIPCPIENHIAMDFHEQTWIGHAPAKLNLFFDVLNKRQDGYHNVFSVCCPISLCDTLSFLPQSGKKIGFSVNCCFARPRYSDKMEEREIPEDARNLVVRAVELVRETYKVRQTAEIKLTKRIPPQAGLGGGSSDAAMAIMLANRAWKLGLSQNEMMALGAKLGSDVPLFFIPGFSLGTGRGETVKAIPSPLRFDLVVIKPAEGIATKDAFELLADHHDGTSRCPDSLIDALKQGNLSRVGHELFNRLEPVALRLCPQLHQIRNVMGRLDCPAFQMSGSGTAFFGVCRNRRHAAHVAAKLRNFKEWHIFQVQSLSFHDNMKVPVIEQTL